ncbi:MAG: hypothetical protein A3K19_24575 [Lentisphaerae bacterium RIFOXYB12_FULL_65_16]|nr:MAG: hypothetical protein A3K18_17380 [Lentisphaerae bacterium RIFOXYA12_64_32]OGV83985.1 MAG: hypothetical protein A3K19_24575 [Lentisphaerae bacterium RIFOXYB12_FULL_65_16]
MITHRQTKLLQQAQSRHGRRKSGVFLCEGLRCCREGLTRRPDWFAFGLCATTLAESADWVALTEACPHLTDRITVIPDRQFADFAVTENPQGVLCVFEYPESDLRVVAPRDAFVLILDRVQDPGNLGTILRTAWAVGLRDVWLTRGAVDPFNPKAIRAGMGAQFVLNLPVFASLSEAQAALTETGYPRLWCAGPRGGVGCFDEAFVLPQSGLVIGNEAAGVGPVNAAQTVTIPMPGDAESLNAAQAATVLLFEAVRRGVVRSGGPWVSG